jgi:hypothetical protein
MSTRFENFINAILLSDSIEEEREVIANELAQMRTVIKDGDPSLRPRTVAKLIYLAMYGENVSWGQMEVVKLMTVDLFSYKRIGYLAATALLNENMEVIVLITATVQKDLSSANPQIQKLALNLIANVGTTDLSQSLPQEVLKLIDSPDPTVQKRAAMAAVTILRKNPDVHDQFRPMVSRLLNSASHCCVLAGIHLAIEILGIQPGLRDPWSQFSKACTAVLKTLFELKIENEYTFMIFNDPFLQILLLRLIGALKNPSDELDDLLSSIATGSDIRRNAGRSILLQTVGTIGLVARKPSLRSLAFNQVGRLFQQGGQPNVIYSALSAFSRILYAENAILDRSSSDSQVLHRYKSDVVHCLDHRDPSIRRRALDVVAALVDESNVESLIPEVITYVRLADRDFRTELVAKIFSSVQRFAPSVLWNFDTTLRLLVDSGSYVGNDVIVSFCQLIANQASIREHAIRALSDAIKSNADNQPLLQVAAWALGEFQEDPSDTLDVMMRLTTLPQTGVETKLVLLTALSKLGVRFGQTEKVGNHLKLFVNNNNLEVQQRAGELVRVLARPDVSEQLLAPVELDESAGAAAETPDVPESRSKSDVSLIDIIGDITEPPAKPAPEVKSQLAVNGPPGSVEALRTSDYVIYFELQSNPNNPRQLGIRSTVYGLGQIPLTNFLVQYGVPQGWLITAQPPSTSVLEALGGNPIRQVLFLQNNGVVPLRMATQISYMYRTQPIKEQGQINPIFG